MHNKQSQAITNFLKQHSFEVKHEVDDFIKRNSRTFTSPIRNSSGNKLFIKAQLSPDKKVHQRLTKEIKFYEGLLSNSIELHWLLTLHPKLSYIDDTCVIMVFDEVQAVPLAAERYLQKHESINEQEIEKMIEIIKSLQGIPLKTFDKALLTQRTYNKYIKDIEKYNSRVHDQEVKNLCQRVKKSLIQHSSFLDEASLVLCHGDLLFKNFLRSATTNDFYLVDLEGLGTSHDVYDVVYLWNTMVFRPDLQKLLRQKFFSANNTTNDSVLQTLWRLVALKTTLGEINLWEQEMLQHKTDTYQLSKEIIALHKKSINKHLDDLAS